MQDISDEPLELLRVGGGDGSVASLHYFEGQHLQGVGIEGRGESAELVEQNPHRPNIRFERVGLIFDDLGREVVWGSHHCASLLLGLGKYSRDPEISELKSVGLSDEDVLPLYVPMQNLSVVHVLHRQAELCEPVQDLRFIEEAFRASLVGYCPREIAAFGVLHNYL